jgi:hypothetical protein
MQYMDVLAALQEPDRMFLSLKDLKAMFAMDERPRRGGSEWAVRPSSRLDTAAGNGGFAPKRGMLGFS